jgi:hypothetical protein
MKDERLADTPEEAPLLTPAEIASCEAIVRRVGGGSMTTLMEVRRPDVGNRILDAARGRLQALGFVVVVVRGDAENVLGAAWSQSAAARLAALKKGRAPGATVLIVKDAHLLSVEKLDLLEQAGDFAIVAAPALRYAAARRIASRRRFLAASLAIVPVVLAFALGAFLLSSGEQRGATASIAEPPAPAVAMSAPAPPAVEAEPPAETAAPDVGGGPGLLLEAKAGETLQTLYEQVYRGATPPAFAAVAALNPQPVRPGDILTFPEPPTGWALLAGQPQSR